MAGDSSVGSSYATGGYLETVLGVVAQAPLSRAKGGSGLTW